MPRRRKTNLNKPEDFVQLVNLRVTREQRLSCGHLSKDAAHTPDIHRSGVGTRPEEDFRGSVPQSDDFVGVRAQRHIESTSQTKVSQLHSTALVHQQVLRLQVAVQNAVRVAVGEAIQQLIREFLHSLSVHACLAVHEALEISIHKLEHQVQLGIKVNHVQETMKQKNSNGHISVCMDMTLRRKGGYSPNHVGMINLLQERDFTDGSRGYAFI